MDTLKDGHLGFLEMMRKFDRENVAADESEKEELDMATSLQFFQAKIHKICAPEKLDINLSTAKSAKQDPDMFCMLQQTFRVSVEYAT